MDTIYNKKYAVFLEETLREIVQMPVSGICIVVKQDEGSVFTKYYNSTMMDKIIYAGVIQQDLTLDVLKASNAIGRDPNEDSE